MIRDKFIIVGLVILPLIASCTKDTMGIPPVFEGTICTEQEVDLGLSANWAGYNIGAHVPQEYGNHYAWGEVETKPKYLQDNYTQPSTDILSADNDVASKEWGYGWHMPSVSDIQELLANCDVAFVLYEGVEGWAVTSRVHGYEGRSIFFPASGYRAGENLNYQGSQCVFWSNALISEGAAHAVNAFFDGSSLKLNTPPYGKGGTLWCGYAIRPVRQFFLDIDTKDVRCVREQTEVTFNVTGNTRWTASVNGEGASITPQSGEGPGLITVSFPQNDTKEKKCYDVKISSNEVEEPLGFTITQFGIMPDFFIADKSRPTVAWDSDELVKFNLTASPEVSWTTAVVFNGVFIEDAVVSPESGAGSAEISVKLPKYLDPFADGQHEVVITTDNSKIEDEFSELIYEVKRSRCLNIPFGFSWGEDFFLALTEEFKKNNTADSYLVHNTTINPKAPGVLITDGSLGKSLTLSFQSAESGDAILSIKATVASNQNATKKINIYLNDSLVHSLANSTGANITMEEDIKIPNIQKGDLVKVTMSDSNNHKLYSMSFNKAL